MCIGLVGLSSPCGYLYDHQRLFTDKQPWHWNPVLESPVGLATLFDEIWFLHRALCPQTMRTLNFVRFLNEDSGYANIIDSELGKLWSHKDKEIEKRVLNLQPVNRKHIQRFGEVIRAASGMIPGPDAPIDNHSHGIKLGQNTVSGNAWSSENLAFDLVITQKLSSKSGKRVELITNTFTNACILPTDNNLAKLVVSQAIVVRRIPVLQTVQGPVLENIDRVRENDYLADFRKKVSSAVSNTDIQEMNHLVPRIEKEFVDYRNEVLLEHHAKADLFESIARNLISIVAGKVLPPGILEVADLLEASETRRDASYKLDCFSCVS